MNRVVAMSVAGTMLLAHTPPAAARSHRGGSAVVDKAAADSTAATAATPTSGSASAAAGVTGAAAVPVGGAPPAAAVTGSVSVTAPLPASSATPALALPQASAGAPPQYALPPSVSPPPQSALPPQQPAPLILPTRTRKYWELSAVGGIVLGGVYVLSVLAGAFSYAGFYQGQWGFFVPLVGPALTLGNVGGQVCPCAASQLYAYGIGSVLSIATVGALVPIVLGGILTKNVPVQSARVQLVPTLSRDAYGFQLVSRF